jgi:hypothetical protein
MRCFIYSCFKPSPSVSINGPKASCFIILWCVVSPYWFGGFFFFFLMVRWIYWLLSLVGVNVYAVTYERHYVSYICW